MTTTLSCWRSRPETDAGEGPCARFAPRYKSKYRRVHELWLLAGHSIEEAAHVMAVSVSNAKVIQRGALRVTARRPQEAAR